MLATLKIKIEIIYTHWLIHVAKTKISTQSTNKKEKKEKETEETNSVTAIPHKTTRGKETISK